MATYKVLFGKTMRLSYHCTVKTLTLVFLLFVNLASVGQPDYDCKLWGFAAEGGKYGAGTIFSYDLNDGALQKHADFESSPTGFLPQSTLLFASDSLFYGAVLGGGSGSWSSGASSCNGCGTFVSFDPSTDALTKLYNFDYDSGPGALPYGGPIEVGNGKYYGMTYTGINNSGGAIYEYDATSHTMINRRYFSPADGYAPMGSLLGARNGLLYGMTQAGGTADLGVLFSYDPVTGNFSKLLDFMGASNGRRPQGDLIQASTGILYGMTTLGGQYGNGVLFSFDSLNTFTKLHDFNASAGGYDPQGSLLEASNGKLYGLCSKGGANANGTLFEFDPASGALIDKFSFGYSSGKMPLGSLMQASNGKLYGVTTLGGSASVGTLFEYDLNTGVVTRKADFNTATGSKPRSIRLVERCAVMPEAPIVTGPNIFTPNGDGVNDSWAPLVQRSYYLKDLEFSIYNRWGQKIFTGDKTHGWTGTLNGMESPDGTYYYLISYTDIYAKSHSLKGFLTLVR